MFTDLPVTVTEFARTDPTAEYPVAHCRVRLPVQAPKHRTAPDDPTAPDTLVQLVDSEGWVEVSVDADGCLVVRGCQAMDVELNSSNQLRVRLRDDR